MKWAARITTILCLAVVVSGCSRPTTDSTLPAERASHEAAGEWSAVADHLRGRLIANSSLDAQGTTAVRIYLELQNLAAQPFFGKRISFSPEHSLAWELRDSGGNPVAPWKGPVPWIFDFPTIASWISIPGDATLRFPVCSAGYHTFQRPGVLVLYQGLITTRPWLLAQGGKGSYFLSATLRSLIQGKAPSEYVWSGILLLPPVRLPTNPIARVWPGNGQTPPLHSQAKP